ncbi:hypothetical protein [Natronorubrum bangense]|uniref:Uncharacterized protein n=2 Tax=Natronorubrum bangense TaxID=61858 RepID=L9WCH5_9EURY|nr:hypothetical protein [Natronorubrum bangense]ELY47169.1 hypothetical protein C494_13241 [Natronorubrum bangense JCM 10635]QCC53397.1 hypothetical protein DV706_02190 [Natronorubrum bangense]
MSEITYHGLEYESGGGIETDATLVRKGIWPTLKRTVQVKLVETLPIPLGETTRRPSIDARTVGPLSF